MNSNQISYLVFGIVLILAVIFDLGLLSKRETIISIRKALWQTFFWVFLALAFGAYLWYSYSELTAIEYISAYLMEWSLSIDNIFVFILIFTFFRVHKDHYARALIYGILIAIILRIIFITVGVALVQNFEWILYIFGAFLVYTGVRLFAVKQDDGYDPANNIVYRNLRKFFPIVTEDLSGKFTVVQNGKRYYTSIFVVVVMLATTDIVFAVDSIPAVFAITQDKLVIYTSNIFAVLGLRSLFFLLQGAVIKFKFLQQGIAIVLVFIGLKMLAEYFHFHLEAWISLIVIIVCLIGSIIVSVTYNKNED
jgi:tellurite resistance protein TerC